MDTVTEYILKKYQGYEEIPTPFIASELLISPKDDPIYIQAKEKLATKYRRRYAPLNISPLIFAEMIVWGLSRLDPIPG